MRWQPCSAENGSTTAIALSNPYTAPEPAEDSDGRTGLRYRVEFSDEEPPRVKRAEWKHTSEGADEDTTAWHLNGRAAEAIVWLASAAETAAGIAGRADDETVREIFPSLREIRKRREEEAAANRAADARKAPAAGGTANPPPHRTIH